MYIYIYINPEQARAAQSSREQPQQPRAADLKPHTSSLTPRASSLEPQTSGLRPPASDLKPQTSSLRPQTSNLEPQTSSLKPQAPDPQPRARRHGRQPFQFEIRLAQANVLSLSPAEERGLADDAGLRETGRTQELQRVLAPKMLHIMGAQEARTSGPGCRHMADFCAITSGATPRGQYGCELWFSRINPFTIGDALYHLSPKHVTTI